MKYNEFVEKYCSDLILDSELSKLDYDKLEKQYSYDRIITDSEGRLIKVIDTEDGVTIPVIDIIELSRKDFIFKYPQDSSLVARDNYLSMFTILTPEEDLAYIQKLREAEEEKLNMYRDKSLDDLMSW